MNAYITEGDIYNATITIDNDGWGETILDVEAAEAIAEALEIYKIAQELIEIYDYISTKKAIEYAEEAAFQVVHRNKTRKEAIQEIAEFYELTV